MDDGKNWWESRGIWGGIVAVVAGAAGCCGYAFSAEDQAQLTNLIVPVVSAVGGIAAIIGRKLAKKQIGGSNNA